MEFEREMLIVFFVILLVWLLVTLYRGREGFDADGREFLPVGYPRYGLRGDLLRTESIDTMYIKENPDVRLHHTNNEMYDSNNTPAEEGIEGCVKVPCPCTNGDNYYDGSPCWKCSGSGYVKQKIPPIHPHVMN